LATSRLGAAGSRRNFKRWNVIRAKQEIDAARSALGHDYRYAVENGAAPVQRWTWDCGCMLVCSGNGHKGVEPSFHWNRCGGHLQCGEVEQGILI
jgi:hypothetical protein